MLNRNIFKPMENARNIGNYSDKVRISTLSDEPEIYADNEEDRDVLRSCYYE